MSLTQIKPADNDFPKCKVLTHDVGRPKWSSFTKWDETIWHSALQTLLFLTSPMTYMSESNLTGLVRVYSPVHTASAIFPVFW